MIFGRKTRFPAENHVFSPKIAFVGAIKGSTALTEPQSGLIGLLRRLTDTPRAPGDSRMIAVSLLHQQSAVATFPLVT